MIWLILLATLVALFYIYTYRCFKYWENRNVYFEKPVPIFGNFYDVAIRKKHMGDVLQEIHMKLDENIPYFGVYIFHAPNLVVRTKEMIKEVLIKNFASFPNRMDYTNEVVDPLSAYDLFSMKEEMWKFTRSKLSPAFSSGKMKNMYPLMKEVSNHLHNLLVSLEGQEVDVRDLSKRFLVDIISSCAFGINAESLQNKNSKIKAMADQMLDQRGFVRSFAVFAWFFCPLLVDIFRLPFVEKESSDFLVDVFLRSYKERKKLNVKRNDLIDLLHELVGEKSQNDLVVFDEIKMSAQAMAFFNAGEGTSSILLTLCLYEMAMNIDIQEKLREEIRKTLDSTGELSYENVLEMEYLDMVTKETLRKYPFLQLLQRYCVKDHTFETGLTVKKGQRVLIPTLALHYDPRYYPEPEKFNPERFRGDKIKDLQYVFLPFGDGPRKCIGARFGLMSMKTGLATILKDFEVVPGPQTEIPLRFEKAAFFTTPESAQVMLKLRKVA
ncbi:cytochrome P450 6j1-like isoform X2 [Coccinella septempunctata]|nr:cytochrome P450 6j1-like isoform X2 [Coccinella septempunctata]XP_044755550.1 cytochrome P450 6j1-like isoform X2 [Coccinella septempunctata]